MNTIDCESAMLTIEKYLVWLGITDFQKYSQFSNFYLFDDEVTHSDCIVSYLDVKPEDLNFYWNVSALKTAAEKDVLFCIINTRSSIRSTTSSGRKFDFISEYNQSVIKSSGKIVIEEPCLIGFRHEHAYFAEDTKPRQIVVTGQELGILKYDRNEKTKIVNKTRALMGLEYMAPENWFSVIKMPGSPSISLHTDPTGVKELWKIRDVPDGYNRRLALIHWVGAHWRKTRNDPDVEAYVRKHLRGAERCTCGDLIIDIVPSKSDRLKVEEEIENKIKMKRMKRNRRKKGEPNVS